jgi:hypothetical protein
MIAQTPRPRFNQRRADVFRTGLASFAYFAVKSFTAKAAKDAKKASTLKIQQGAVVLLLILESLA